MRKWEYLVKKNLDDRDLNLYGIDGWDLVAVIQVDEKDDDTREQWTEPVYYFKRPLEDQQLKLGHY